VIQYHVKCKAKRHVLHSDTDTSEFKIDTDTGIGIGASLMDIFQFTQWDRYYRP